MITSTQDARKSIIDDVQLTPDTLTGRGGLALVARYVRGIELLPDLERVFGSIRRSRKGQSVSVLFHQLICFLVDGTSRHLVRFDELKQDPGYAGAIEIRQEQMVSSHMVKRFFNAFCGVQCWLFRRVLQQLFLWRVNLQQPGVILLGIDAMVMNNSEAGRREGVQPTYKKGVKGFAPLQITWGRFIIDAVFRGGRKHSNADDTVAQALRHIVSFVRTHYRPDVAIIVRMDSGFFDQKLFAVCEDLGIGYVCGGKLYDDLTPRVRAEPADRWARYENRQQAWQYLEFEDQRTSWQQARRTLYLRPIYEDEQCVLEFARPETVLYTNLGCGELIDGLLEAAGHGDWPNAPHVIEFYHDRGADELVHRALKEFGDEQLPFRRFAANCAFYYTMLVAFFVYECFKEDVAAPVVPVTARPTRVRRVVLDFAAKLVRTSHRTILKVTATTWDQLRIAELWQRSGSPPRFAWG